MKAIRHTSGPVEAVVPGEHAVEKRARAELALKADRVEAAVKLLHMTGRCAVVAEQSASLQDFKEGLTEKVGRGKGNEEKVLWLPAKGNIQDIDYNQAKETDQAISRLRQVHGFVVLGFEGIDFAAPTDVDSSRATRRLGGILKRQDEQDQKDVDRRRRLGRQFAEMYVNKHRRNFGIVFLGTGEPENLIPKIHYTEEGGVSPQLLSVFAHRLALLETGELAAEFPILQELDHDEDPPAGQRRLGI